ncbi:MAG: tetratricopeptide repeat protein [Fibrobacter sp.]|jgi:tetratricopeptide (TPR) repeat protein|nr:tetratricopeptide repeat protein [Fibrobacter sp.]
MNIVLTAILTAVQNLQRLNHFVITLISILWLTNTAFAAQPLPLDLQSAALAAIDLIYQEQFKKAEEEARFIIKKYPEHPAGYFFMAVVLDSWAAVYQSNKKVDEFYRYCDLAIEKGENLLAKDSKNQWAKFFIAGADGYKGTFEARYEKWITAFRYGWKGVSLFLEMEKEGCTIADINYGIGSYDYWRSALIKILWFMSKVDDKRQRAINRLYYAQENGLFTRTSSSAALVDILINESRYSEALDIAERLLLKYPGSIIFNWGKARALFGLERYEESMKVFRALLSKVESDPHDNHYTASLCHLWMAKIEMKLGNYSQAITECNRVGYYDFEEGIRKRLEKQFSEAADIRKAATQMMKK